MPGNTRPRRTGRKSRASSPRSRTSTDCPASDFRRKRKSPKSTMGRTRKGQVRTWPCPSNPEPRIPALDRYRVRVVRRHETRPDGLHLDLVVAKRHTEAVGFLPALAERQLDAIVDHPLQEA